ncbi:hypothetical protein SGCOL_001368 [Colletotrichum sp. CLE4]
MIKQGYFAKETSLSLLYDTEYAGKTLEFGQRKALATRLVLGLMICLDSNDVFESWDPKHIYFLEPVDTQRTPFVSITRKGGRKTHQIRPLLSELRTCSGDEDDPRPLPQFALLAKALLQIASGDRLENVKIARPSGPAFRDEWKKLRRLLDWYTQNVTCGTEVDLQILPLLIAAQCCLEFHLEYRNRLRETQSSQKIDIARKVVFDTILVNIDDSLTLKSVVGSSLGILTDTQAPSVSRLSLAQDLLKSSIPRFGVSTVRPSQPKVALFDSKQGTRPSTADDFWRLLDEFHSSYSNSVTSRIMNSEVESPRRIRIAVLDTGIDFAHPGIQEAMDKGRMKREWCHSWIGSETKDDDNELHGSSCAFLQHKAAPEADIYVEKVFQKNAVRDYEAKHIAKAIEHAANTWDVDIISMSFGLRPPTAREDGDKVEEERAMKEYEQIVDDIENAIVDASIRSRRLMFAAASNSGKNEPCAFPARFSQVFCVHASEGNGEDGGINPELETGFNFMTLGMGLKLLEKKPGGSSGYRKAIKSGTSFATPIAAGIAATVLDLATRVREIKPRAKNKLKRHDMMEKMLQMMSSPKNDVRDRLCYMAPWHHWKSGWQMNETERRLVWDTINSKLS